MRLSGRIAASMEVLADIDTRHRPAAIALRDWGTSHRFAGSGDRAAIGNLVYDALRKRASHAYAMGEDTPRALTLSVAVRDWGESAEALQKGFAEDRFAPEPLTDDEIAHLTKPDPLADAPDHVRADVPEWLAPALQLALGENWIAEAKAMSERPPLDLRVNALKSGRDRVLKALKRFNPEPTALAPHGIHIAAGTGDARTPNVISDEAYIKGWFEVQDQGSQIVAQLAGAKPGGQILDLCAGAGGKTLALASAMGNKGQIFAYDSDRKRLAPIYDRIKRNNVRNVQVRPPEEDALNDLSGKMDMVLVDAPCTGTGTWRRRPDTKWRLTPEQLATRCEEQAKILELAMDFVKPGGRLVYITCSILPEENQSQIKSLLAKAPNFSALDSKQVWSSQFGNETTQKPLFDNLGLTLTPLSCGTDGFFISILERSLA